MESLFELALESPARGARDATRLLYQQLRDAILDGRLKPGMQLPATRQAAVAFGVSRNTASEVYDRLRGDGLTVGRQGSGTFIAARIAPAVTSPVPANNHSLNPFWQGNDVAAALGFWHDQAPATGMSKIDFRPALIDADAFPMEQLRRVTLKQMRNLERKPARNKSPQGNQGSYALRDAITRHIALTRAVACHVDDVLVTSGAQQAFDLLARVLVIPGQTVVAVEDPGYPPMRVPFMAAGARIVAVPIDAEGLVVDALTDDVKIVCVTPSHQFPLGVTMSAARRAALLDWAQQHGAVIIEDDYDGEFRHGTQPLKALRSSDAADIVFYVGTFSKCMLPSLRLGFLVAPRWAMASLVMARNCLDWHSPLLTQLAVSAFISEGLLAQHLRKMRLRYKTRRDRLLHALTEQFGAWLEPIDSSYGMHVTALASERVRPGELETVSTTLLNQGIHLHTLQRYSINQPARHGLIFGLGATNNEQIADGLAQLRKLL
jgi:GntR family transcriptional regulator/MocR family aminotransferase